MNSSGMRKTRRAKALLMAATCLAGGFAAPAFAQAPPGAGEVEERAALRQRDHRVRELGYTMDPMNELSKKFLGAQRVEELVATRAGLGQIAEMEKRA